MSLDDVDIYDLAASVSSLTSQLESLNKKLDSAVTGTEFESVAKDLKLLKWVQRITNIIFLIYQALSMHQLCHNQWCPGHHGFLGSTPER